MDIRRIGSIKGPDNTDIGNRVKVKIVKNKVAPPFQVAEFDILFNKGISALDRSSISAQILASLIKKAPGLTTADTVLVKEEKLRAKSLRKQPKMADEIEKAVFEIAAKNGPSIKPKKPLLN